MDGVLSAIRFDGRSVFVRDPRGDAARCPRLVLPVSHLMSAIRFDGLSAIRFDGLSAIRFDGLSATRFDGRVGVFVRDSRGDAARCPRLVSDSF